MSNKIEPYKKITIQLEVDLNLESLGKTEDEIYAEHKGYCKFIRYLIETKKLTFDDKHLIVTGATIKIQENDE